jgi:hypothetical protein
VVLVTANATLLLIGAVSVGCLLASLIVWFGGPTS